MTTSSPSPADAGVPASVRAAALNAFAGRDRRSRPLSPAGEEDGVLLFEDVTGGSGLLVRLSVEPARVQVRCAAAVDGVPELEVPGGTARRLRATSPGSWEVDRPPLSEPLSVVLRSEGRLYRTPWTVCAGPAAP